MIRYDDMLKTHKEVGEVVGLDRGLAYVTGLPQAVLNEIIVFESGTFGQVYSLGEDRIEVLLIEREEPQIFEKAARTKKTPAIGVGPGLLGKVLDPLGRPLDGEEPLEFEKELPLDSLPLGIDNRSRITEMMITGVAMVDLVVPLGRGQRELVIGDRKTGKTSFLLQTIRSQVDHGTVCVYGAIGKNQAEVKAVVESFRLSKIADKILVIASFSSDPSGLIVQTPYAAMTAAEYFRDQGRDVLVVLDDLTTHAKFYREIALLAGRFPGRDSYPADMFYQHARLLERAGSFKADKGGSKTITCLPVAESLEGDITGLIQTNLMSMTDGHIFFDSNIFTKGRRPAVNPFLSVTRVGRQTQDKVGRGISHELSSLLVLYEKSETFSHFGAEMSEGMKMTMNTGKNIYDFFRQSSFETVPLFMQYLLFTFVWIGYWNSKEEGQMRRDIQKACAKYRSSKTVRQVVDDLCQGSGSLNELLGKVQKNLRNLESDLFL